LNTPNMRVNQTPRGIQIMPQAQAVGGGGSSVTNNTTGAVPYFCNLNFESDNTLSVTTGGVTQFSVTAGGSGFTSVPTVAITGGAGVGAIGTAVVTGGIVTSISVATPGAGYTSNPTVSITGGGGTGATALASINFLIAKPLALRGFVATTTDAQGSAQAIQKPYAKSGGLFAIAPINGTGLPNGGVVSDIIKTSIASGYTAPTVTFSGGGASTQATATAIMVSGRITGYTLLTGGIGYTSAPTITVTDSTGAGATAKAFIYTPTMIDMNNDGRRLQTSLLTCEIIAGATVTKHRYFDCSTYF